MSKTETAITWMETTAKNDSHGYDQKYRWGQKGDYDCSAAVIAAWESAGVPVKSSGASYTGNMLGVFLKCGFSDVTRKINLSTGSGLVRGDILLRVGHHTAMYCGSGKEVEASINEKGKAIGGVPGDQTGKEFLIRSYRNYPWDHVLRYTAESTDTTTTTSATALLKKGSSGQAVKDLQTLLIKCGFSCGASGADGIFGAGTYRALASFQKTHGLLADGIYGPKTKSALESAQSQPVVQKKSQLAVDGKLGPATIRALQAKLGVTGDGIMGPNTIKSIQRWAGVTADGIMGPNTRKAVQRKLGVTADGIWGTNTTKALQRLLNN